MKVFSLQTKKHLVGWSVLLGVIVDYIIIKLTYGGYACIQVVGAQCPSGYAGWPFKFDIWKQTDYLNLPDLFFWIIISFIILFATRHFNKNN